MLDINYIIENTDEVKKNFEKRNFDNNVIDDLLSINLERKKLTQFVETGRAEIKQISKEIGKLKKNGEDAVGPVNKVAEIKKRIENQNVQLDEIKTKQHYLLSTLPNLLDQEIPEGLDEDSNLQIKEWGTIPEFSFTAKDHVQIGEELGMLDFEKASKISGPRFAIYKGDLARLERALINFMLDQHIKNGYQEILPPFIVNEKSLFGTGQLPKFEDDLFKVNMKDKNWYLVPTAEVPLTNLKREELFSKKELPLKYCAYTPCFRSEAGSYGKDTRGLIRLHQFNKVELVNIVDASESVKAHQDMIDRATSILELLQLPYRAMLLCGGETGFGARKCIDLEIWLPGQKKYREISSISNCWDFQARRASIRYRDNDGKPQFAHTLNGSGLAVGRTVVAIMENFQQNDGTVKIPEILHSYMGGIEVLIKK